MSTCPHVHMNPLSVEFPAILLSEKWTDMNGIVHLKLLCADIPAFLFNKRGQKFSGVSPSTIFPLNGKSLSTKASRAIWLSTSTWFSPSMCPVTKGPEIHADF